MQTARPSNGSNNHVKWRSLSLLTKYFLAKYIGTQIMCIFCLFFLISLSRMNLAEVALNFFTLALVSIHCTYLSFLSAGLKCRSQVRLQVTGHRSGCRSDHRPQVRSQVRSQVTQKTIRHWTKLFLIDIKLYKNKTSQGTSIILFLF